MPDKEKVMQALDDSLKNQHCGFVDGIGDVYAVSEETIKNIIALLKEQEGHVSVPFSWLVKFCTHIDFVEPLTDAEREAAWRQKLRQQFGINITKKVVKLE